MIKKFVIFTVAFTALFSCVYGFQNFILSESLKEIRFSVFDTNVFFALSSWVICIHFEIFSNIKRLQPQLGFIYLPTLFIKGILFFAMYKSSVFSINSLSSSERLNLLVPFFVFLALEVFFITQILNPKQSNS